MKTQPSFGSTDTSMFCCQSCVHFTSTNVTVLFLNWRLSYMGEIAWRIKNQRRLRLCKRSSRHRNKDRRRQLGAANLAEIYNTCMSNTWKQQLVIRLMAPFCLPNETTQSPSHQLTAGCSSFQSPSCSPEKGPHVAIECIIVSFPRREGGGGGSAPANHH